MSPLWRDRVFVFLESDAVHLTRYGRGLRPRETSRYHLACEPGSTGGWQGSIETLGRALRNTGWRRADAHVTVSNQFVRVALVAGANKLRGDEERAAAARHTLRTIFGDAAEAWRIALDQSGATGTAVAAGIESDFVDSIITTLDGAHLHTIAVEPLLATALNFCRRNIQDSPAWFVVAEKGRVALGYLEGDAWRTLRNQRLRATLSEELPLLLEQSRLADGIESVAGRVIVASRDPLKIELPRGSQWTVQCVALDGLANAAGAGI